MNRPSAVLTVARAHLTVWKAELRETLGGRGRVAAIGGLVLVAVVGTAILSWGVAPGFGDSTNRDRAVHAVLVVVFVVGALVWTAMSLALPDSSAVDTLLTAVPADARERRVGLALITVIPALTLTLVVALAVCGGLVRDLDGGLAKAGAAAVVVGASVLGLGSGAIVAGLLAVLLRRTRVVGPATSRGLAAALTVAAFGVGLLDVMRDVDAAATIKNPVRYVGELGAAGIDHPAPSLLASALAVVVGIAAVAVGAALGRSAKGTGAPVLTARWSLRTDAASRRVPRWVSIQARQLARYQPNVGLFVLVSAGAAAALVAAGGRSAIFAHSAYFALSSLLTTSAVTVAGIEGRADWLYHHLGRWRGHVLTRLGAFLLGWAGFALGFGGLLAWRSPEFTFGDVLGLLPILLLELGVVLVLGGLVPVSDEHGLSAISGEFASIVAVLLVAIGLPRVPGLSEVPWAMPVVGVLGGVIGVVVFLLLLDGRRPTSRVHPEAVHAA